MYDNFDVREYREFLKRIYAKCDTVVADFDTVISDIDALKKGKYTVFLDSLIEVVIDYDNGFPFTALRMKKNYWLYDYLNNISDWESFSEFDPISEYQLQAIHFYRGKDCIGGILSHYRDYNNNFYEFPLNR